MKKTAIGLLAIFGVLLVHVSGAMACYYDYGDAPGYGTAKHDTPSWQRLGGGWSSETAQRAVDTYDDGVTWSVNGGAFSNDQEITQGDTVTFRFVMYKLEWGRHSSDYVRAWVDWDQDKKFDDGILYTGAWDFKTLNGGFDLGQIPTTPYAYGDGLAQVYKTFEYTMEFDDVAAGDYWLRARVTCDESIGRNLNNLTPYGELWQGEVEDYKITVREHVPEPASLLLCCLGLGGLVGIRRKLQR